MKPLALGDVTVTSVVERDGPWRPPEIMYPTCDKETALAHLKTMAPYVYDAAQNMLVITYQTYVVRTPHHTILIDTCLGEDKGYGPPHDFPKQPWLDGMAANGLSYEDIDYVFCTHLHIDHCGWNTRLIDGRWVPTFPNAKYIFSRKEYETWEEETKKGAQPPGNVWSQNCLPIVEAGQAMLVEDDFMLDDTIWLTPTPGHSPGHVCVNLKSGGKQGLFTGDMMHHALQCIEPDWSSCFCWDADQSAHTRRKVLDSVADTDTVVLPAHFPGPTAGHVVGDGDTWRFKFLDD
jgi:glyoxylase-like metal-dependent hydrolase (beta-lactamase superfamily II)